MIYICCIIYWDYVVTYVLTVRDDELAVGDSDDRLLEVANGGHMWECQGTHVDGQHAIWQAGSSQPALQRTVGMKTLYNHNFVFIFEFYSLMRIQ